MKEFDELVVALKLSRKKCPWAKVVIPEDHVERLRDEVRELVEAMEQGPDEEIREELADVIWDALFIAIIDEEQNKFTIHDMFKKATEKLKRRKPWVFGKEKVTTARQAVQRWNEIKAHEKQAKKRKDSKVHQIK